MFLERVAVHRFETNVFGVRSSKSRAWGFLGPLYKPKVLKKQLTPLTLRFGLKETFFVDIFSYCCLQSKITIGSLFKRLRVLFSYFCTFIFGNWGTHYCKAMVVSSQYQRPKFSHQKKVH